MAHERPRGLGSDGMVFACISLLQQLCAPSKQQFAELSILPGSVCSTHTSHVFDVAQHLLSASLHDEFQLCISVCVQNIPAHTVSLLGSMF